MVTQDADGKITGTASGKVQTTVARVLGIDEVPIGVTSQAVRSLGKIELALVLDNTGSMNTGSKLADLKNAANALVDQLVAATGNPADLKIALVPFSQTVNPAPPTRRRPGSTPERSRRSMTRSSPRRAAPPTPIA